MNIAATLALDAPDGRGRRGLSVGWGASLLVHAAVLAWLLHAPAPRPPDTEAGQRLEVRLAPPRPPAPAAAARPVTPGAPAAPTRPGAATGAAPHARAHARPAPATRAPAYATRPAPARATPDTNAQPATPAATTDAAAGSEAPSESPPAPTVDIAGARQAARLIAREEGKSLVALPARKPVVDPNSGRAPDVDPIERARRADCKTAYAGAGLLAVIPLVADTITGTGCKW